MDGFIRRQNIVHCRQLLEAVREENAKQRILKLLGEEKQKTKGCGRQRRPLPIDLIKVAFSSAWKYCGCLLCWSPSPEPPRANSEGREPLVLHHQGLPPFYFLCGIQNNPLSTSTISSATSDGHLLVPDAISKKGLRLSGLATSFPPMVGGRKAFRSSATRT